MHRTVRVKRKHYYDHRSIHYSQYALVVPSETSTIVGTPSPFIKTFQNWVNWGQGGDETFCYKRGINLKRGGGWNRGRNRGLALFLLFYSSVQSHLMCVGGKKGSLYYFSNLQFFEFATQDFHPRSHPSLVLKLGIICTFPIHSGSLQKMLIASFNLVWNTHRKVNRQFFLSANARCFLALKRFSEISTLNALPHCFSPHVWDKGVTLLLSYNLGNTIKQNWH